MPAANFSAAICRSLIHIRSVHRAPGERVSEPLELCLRVRDRGYFVCTTTDGTIDSAPTLGDATGTIPGRLDGRQSTFDRQVWQRLLKFFHSNVGDPSAVEIDEGELGQRLEAFESGIGDLSAADGEEGESGHALQVR